MDVNVTEKTITAPLPLPVRIPKFSIWDFVVVLVMGGLLFCGISSQLFWIKDDAAKYECYATAFWNGEQAVKSLPTRQCAFLSHPNPPLISQQAFVSSLQRHHVPASIVQFFASQSSTASFHALPHEYPALALIPFSISLLAPSHYSQIPFSIAMILLAIALYFVMLRFRSRQAAIMCAVYLVIGGWVTAAGRFDIIPAILTFLAFLCTTRQRWNLAFALLAIATMLKLYPIYILPAFLLAQQLATKASWRSWRRWVPLGTYVGICLVILLVSLSLNVEGTLAPFGYFKNRPVQVESFSASLLWLISAVTHHHLGYEYTFGSLNIVNTTGSRYSLPGTIVLVAGLLYTLWLQWKLKIDLAGSILLALLIVIITTKVFSPQYLLWAIPFVAFLGEARLRWIIPWIVIGLLTTWVYPFIYDMVPPLQVGFLSIFHYVTTVRNFLFLGCAIAMLITASRRPAQPTATVLVPQTNTR